MSCTDCSGSSTASSDLTDPGSPFSTASSHSEDSASQPAKMPPTQSAHHPPWPWATEDSPPLKRSTSITAQDKPAFASTKRIKMDPTEEAKQSPTCLNNNIVKTQTNKANAQIPNSNISKLMEQESASLAQKKSLKKVTYFFNIICPRDELKRKYSIQYDFVLSMYILF